MKLLIVTQSIDVNNPVLGFFVRWVEEFSKHCEKTTVICLEKGEYHFPKNAAPRSVNSLEFSTTGVKVLSLGKEEFIRSHSYSSHVIRRLVYIYRLYKYIWQERKNYDSVFVHMNQEYVLLAGWLWHFLRKKVFMWRNHHAGSFLTDIASFFCTKVFCTSKYSYTAKYKKTILMPVGIDTNIFKIIPGIKRIPRSILFLSRMSPVKKPDKLIEALLILANKNIDFTADFYGDPLLRDSAYYQALKDRVKNANLDNRIKFYSGIPNYKTPEIYNQHEIFINLSSSGMYDKTIFEAMSCGCKILISNKNLAGQIPDAYIIPDELDNNSLAIKIEKLINIQQDTGAFNKLKEDNNLIKLVEKIISFI